MKKQFRLRTPISYYGGKQKLAQTILSFIPEHRLYCEPFLGGAAIFFAKDPSKVEVINDTNQELINFYRVCRNRYVDLSAMVRTTLHSREDHDFAWVVYNKPRRFDEVTRAWAVWVLSTQSFSSILSGSWGYDKKDDTTTQKIGNKREEFTEQLALRLQHAQIECSDATYIIQSRDQVDSFFYCDPPYYNSNCGHYDGYTEEDFENLLKTLACIKGKFMLSSYPSDLLTKYSKKYKWKTWSVKQEVSVSNNSGNRKTKVEVITANFPLKEK